jgi:Fe-S-cluster containining protein
MPVEIEIGDLLQMGLVSSDDLGVSSKKVFKRLQSKGVITSFRVATGKYMLAQKANSDCYFLDSKTRLCTIYEKRPSVCREFPKIGPRPGCCPYQSK